MVTKKVDIMSKEIIPKKFSNPSHPVNHPDEKKSLDERLKDRKESDRVHMDDKTFRVHYGHEKGEDKRLKPYTG